MPSFPLADAEHYNTPASLPIETTVTLFDLASCWHQRVFQHARMKPAASQPRESPPFSTSISTQKGCLFTDHPAGF